MTQGIKHIPVGAILSRTEWEADDSHQLAYGTSFPASPSERQLFYRTDLHEWYIYNGTDWVSLGAAAAHKDTHDPEDGSDPLDTAAPVKVGEANAIGTSHSFPRADHVHEKHHAKYLNSEAKAAAVQAGAITDGVTKAPTHDAVYDVKVIADAALPAANKYTDAEAVDAIEADDNLPLATITFIIDGGGSAITTGEKGHLEIPFACTINQVTMMADQSGSIVVDIWKDSYANFPPIDADSITASAPPTISSAVKSQDSTLTGWTTAIAAGDILAFNVDSAATITRVTISLKVTKS